MSEVRRFQNARHGCQVKTSFEQCNYEFSWSVENCPQEPTLFKLASSEFRPVNDRLFYATLERIFKSDYPRIVLSFFLKEGFDITIQHRVSVLNIAGEVLKDFKHVAHNHNQFSKPFVVSINELRVFPSKDYQHLTFRNEMEFEVSFTDIYPYHLKPSPQISPVSLVDDLKTMYTNSVHTDLCLNVGESSVRVHKGMLCVRSPVFAKMFESPMGEKEDNVINIDDIELPVVKGLVEFLYTGVLCDDGFDFVYDLYYAADKYDVPSLRKKCTDVLLAKLDVGNACRVLCLADQHSDVHLKDSVMDFMFQFHFEFPVSFR